MNPILKQIITVSATLLAFWVLSFGWALFRSRSLPKAPSLPDHYVQNGDSQIPNRSTVVYFWATWCSVCKANLPLVKWYAEVLPKYGINFRSIEEGDDPSELSAYIQERSVAFPVSTADPDLLGQWQIQGFPTFAILDSKGKIQFQEAGIMSPVGIFLRILYLKLL